MVKGILFSFINLFIVLILYSSINLEYPAFSKMDVSVQLHELPAHSLKVRFIFTGITQQVQQNNHPPVVKIMAPKNNSEYAWNTRVPYTISVSDQEDGESKYDEIAANEVFLEVKYVPDTSNVSAALPQAVQSDPAGLAAIKTSNCLNCHAFDAKLIGPSFYEISERYPPTKSNIDTLVQRIRAGSTGVWGNTVMPTHPELTVEETQHIVHWILENAAEPNTSYYVGTEGTFQLKSPDAAAQTGFFVLSATYTDHGSADEPQLKGQDMVMIRGR